MSSALLHQSFEDMYTWSAMSPLGHALLLPEHVLNFVGKQKIASHSSSIRAFFCALSVILGRIACHLKLFVSPVGALLLVRPDHW